LTDIHCHILHDMDDGPKRLEEAVELLYMAQKHGIDKIVLTPHIHHLCQIERFLEKRARQMEELNRAVRCYGIALRLFPGAEVKLSDDMFYAENLYRLSIHESKYILVEFPYENIAPKRLIRYVDELLFQGLVPIVAHPERYAYFRRDIGLAQFLMERGVLYQINAASLQGMEGKAERKLSWNFIRNGLASFLASDAHSVAYRPNSVLDRGALREIEFDQFQRLLEENPGRVLRDQSIEREERLISV